jgi:hypothetical protein
MQVEGKPCDFIMGALLKIGKQVTNTMGMSEAVEEPECETPAMVRT